VGQRIHGDRRRRARKVGWEYLHVAVDDATRLTYAEVLTAETPRAALPFCNARSRGFVAAASVCAASSRTTQWPIGPVSSPRSVDAGRSVSASRGLIAPRRMEKPSASFKRCCANGPIAGPIGAPRGGPPLSVRISGSTTTVVHTRAGPTLALDAFPRGCLAMNNLFDIHSPSNRSHWSPAIRSISSALPRSAISFGLCALVRPAESRPTAPFLFRRLEL
jgi:hypothetical protein